MVIYYWKLQTPEKLIFKMIRGDNLLLENPNPKNFFNMIEGGAGVGGINDLIHCSEGNLSTCFLPLMCDVKAASSILTIIEQ